MNKEKISKIIRATAFLLCAVTVFCVASSIYERKTYSGAWNYMGKLNEFYNMEENSVDYIGLGSSHMYCTLNPLEVWDESGIPGFVLATQQQPLTATYYYLKEAFKTQSPKYVILEGYMAIGGEQAEEGVIYDAVDPLKPSLNKIQLINALVDEDDRPNYIFNVLKYHSRWKDVTLKEAELAFDHKDDIYKGFVPLNGSFAAVNKIPDYSKATAGDIGEHNKKALADILAVTKENGAELVIMIAPYDAENEKILSAMKSVRDWAEENSVEVLDYSLRLDELGIDPAADYYDGSHLDTSGAAKISREIAKYLENNAIAENENVNKEKWNSDLDIYRKNFG